MHSLSTIQSVLAKVGLGCVAFHEQRFNDALVFFKGTPLLYRPLPTPLTQPPPQMHCA
jgi:hypothetical protein